MYRVDETAIEFSIPTSGPEALFISLVAAAVNNVRRARKADDAESLTSVIDDYDWLNGAHAPVTFPEICFAMNLDPQLIKKKMGVVPHRAHLVKKLESALRSQPRFVYSLDKEDE